MIARLLPAFLFYALCFSFPLFAQTTLAELGCGTTERSPWLDKYQAGRIPPRAKSAEILYVPIQLTVVGDDEGSGYVDPIPLLNNFTSLNADFAKLNVQFYLDRNIEYVNSTVYFDHEFADGQDLLGNFSRQGVFNNFIVGNPAGNCGYYSPSKDAIVLGVNCVSGSGRTWSHEVGHYFGLPHTFFGWESVDEIADVEAFDKPAPATLTFGSRVIEVERVDSSNCADAADGFCDTPPDYLPGRWQCNNAGFYPDSLLDPDSTRFAVPAENIMSYANDNCVEIFSEEQMTAMSTNLADRVGLVSPTTPTFTAARGEDQLLLAPDDRADVPFSDEVRLVWNSVENADFYLVQLNISANFSGGSFKSYLLADTSVVVRDILTPNRRYYWRVRPVNRYDVSGSFSETFFFRNGAFSTATIDPELDAAIVLSPNPVVGNRAIQVSADNTGTERFSYQLLSPAGQVIAQQEHLRTVGGSFHERIETTGLPAGVYFLRMTLDGRLVTRRLVITPG